MFVYAKVLIVIAKFKIKCYIKVKTTLIYTNLIRTPTGYSFKIIRV